MKEKQKYTLDQAVSICIVYMVISDGDVDDREIQRVLI